MEHNTAILANIKYGRRDQLYHKVRRTLLDLITFRPYFITL